MWRAKLSKWKLAGFYPYVPDLGKSLETGQENQSVTGWIDAVVPGCVYSDLQAAGLLPDPYRDMNSLQCEWVEHRWWVYQTRVDIPESVTGNLELEFYGIDYRAHVLWNGELLAEHEGMFLPLRLDVSRLAKRGKSHTLTVVVEGSPDEFGQAGYTCRTSTVKSRFCYKWDFCARLVNLGLYAPVVLAEHGPARIFACDFHVSGAAREGRMHLEVAVTCSETLDCRAEFYLRYGGKTLAVGEKTPRL